MIAVFAAPFVPPILPHLAVTDIDTSESIPIGGLHGWDNDYLQTQTITYAPLEFIDVGEFTGNSDTNSYWCQRLSKGIAKIAFSNTGASVNVRTLWYDNDLNEIMGDATTLTATTRTDTAGHYMSNVHTFDLFGASRIALALDTISAGTVYVKLAGV